LCVCVCVFAAAVPLVAGAGLLATPKPGAFSIGGGEGGGHLVVTAGGKAIAAGATAESNFKCNRMNTMIAKVIPIKNSSFSYSGPSKYEPKVTIIWTGSWSSPTSASGTTRIKSAGCDSGLLHWKATAKANS
jgi:hypothetical protein